MIDKNVNKFTFLFGTLLFVLLIGGTGALAAPGDDSHEEHSLGLDEEAVCYTHYGDSLYERPATITEVIDEKVYPENKKRKEIIQARPTDLTAEPLPEYQSLFGGERFLSSGPIDPGCELDTGATFRPAFVAYGSLRSALQTFNRDDAEGQVFEWANRLDLFGNYSFTTTERLVFGVRALDEDGDFTGYRLSSKRGDRFVNGLDIEPQTFFLEGNIGEIFPSLDPKVMRRRDWGYSLGRQPLNLQDGILVNDHLDAVGITRHNTFLAGASCARISAFFAFNELHRNNRIRDNDATLFALSGCFDYPHQTIETDLVYVYANDQTGGDGLYLGLGQLRQFGYWNSNLRINASFALEHETAAIDNGILITDEFSRVMPYNYDILSVNVFAGIDRYTSAARDPSTGGPLGGFGGLLYRAVGIGTYGAPINSIDENVYGAAVGYQHFLDKKSEKQIAFEAGGNRTWDKRVGNNHMYGATAQYQQRIDQSTTMAIGGFWANSGGSDFHGFRTELNRKF